jgi:hypothetical protein
MDRFDRFIFYGLLPLSTALIVLAAWMLFRA